jgi:hypothetical protein
MYKGGTSCVGVLAPHAQLGLQSSDDRRQRLGFHVVACVSHVLNPPLLFIEHVNKLYHHRSINNLIQIELNIYAP